MNHDLSSRVGVELVVKHPKAIKKIKHDGVVGN